MAITELRKPPAQHCPHATTGQGCDIYQQRPGSCQAFHCLWLLLPAIPEECRPDRTGVVLTSEADGGRVVAHCHPDDPAAWRRAPIYTQLKRGARSGWQQGQRVVAKAGQEFWLLTPNLDLPMGRIEEGCAWRVEETAAGDILLSILTPSSVALHGPASRETRLLTGTGPVRRPG